VIGRFALLMLLLAGGVEAQDGGLVARGQSVFKEQGCYGCHTVGAAGTPIATNLTRIGAKHDEAYLGRWLRDPVQQKPRQHMPKIQLTDAEVTALAAYLGSLR
jgi:mono/diheme cytochrome c family protein